MGQGLLILSTRSLDDFSEGVEHLTRHSYCFEEVGFTGGIDKFLYWTKNKWYHIHIALLQELINHNTNN